QQYTLGFQFASMPPERPIRLPGSNSAEWQTMLRETGVLLRGHLERISTTGALLLLQASAEFGIALPTLSKYFDAVFLRHRGPGELSPGETTSHNSLDVSQVIHDSLAKKRDKLYTTDILLLHTFPKADDF